MNKIYIYGASGHGIVLADIAETCGYKEIVFVDDNGDITFDMIKNDTDIPIVIAVGKNSIREKLYKKAKESGFAIATLAHSSAIISPSAIIGDGVVVMPNVVVNAKAHIGDGAILNTACVIEHECKIGDFAHISPNVALAGNVTVGSLTHIGIGSSAKQGVVVGKNSIIGAGSVIVADIENDKIAYGNPCKVEKDNI